MCNSLGLKKLQVYITWQRGKASRLPPPPTTMRLLLKNIETGVQTSRRIQKYTGLRRSRKTAPHHQAPTSLMINYSLNISDHPDSQFRDLRLQPIWYVTLRLNRTFLRQVHTTWIARSTKFRGDPAPATAATSDPCLLAGGKAN